MVVTLWVVLGLLLVVAVTYPEDFPTLVRNPNELLQAVALETKRQWMILKFGSILWVEKKKLQYSLWKARDIIAAERAKQQAQEETNID